MATQHEANISTNISKFMQRQYPKVIYRYDIADLNLTKPQAVRMKALQGERRGYPDLFIAEPKKAFTAFILNLKKIIAMCLKKMVATRKLKEQ